MKITEIKEIAKQYNLKTGKSKIFIAARSMDQEAGSANGE
jgi:hypothetical protein